LRTALPPAFAAAKPATIFCAGDVLLGRAAKRSAGWDPLRRFSREIASADLAFCNLECALTDAPRASASRVRLLAPPDSVRFLRRAGFDAVSLANNHALDGGADGLKSGLRALKAARIAGLGARIGEGPWPAWETAIRGTRVAWVAASAYGPFRSGSARVRSVAGTGLIEQVRSLAKSGRVVLVSLHWGIEFSPFPTPGQRRTAHALIDAGAAAVIGGHPHVAQPVEVYRSRPIFYSLGNFRFHRMTREQDGTAVLLTVGKDRSVRFQTFPVVPCDEGLPSPPAGEKAVKLLRGRFLANDPRPQVVAWTRRRSGHVVRAYVRTENGWLQFAEGHPPSIYAAEAGDVDGDGRDELLLGLNQPSKLDFAVRKRLHVYALDRRKGFRAKWRGSALVRPLREFRLLPSKKGDELATVEESREPNARERWLSVYRWNGFGFRQVWSAPVRGEIEELTAGEDEAGPFLRFFQATGGLRRVLSVRPAPPEPGREAAFRSSVESPEDEGAGEEGTE
jgi:poly-gamma-glutamate synthesis protein (capsule biosynthesis protein)